MVAICDEPVFFFFHQLYFLLTAGTIGDILKCNLFLYPGIGTVLHCWDTEKKVYHHPISDFNADNYYLSKENL